MKAQGHDMSNSLTQSFQQLPRALKWAVVAAFGLILFLIWSSYLDPIAQDFNRDAEQIESKVRDVRSIRDLNDQTKKLIEVVGPVEFPKSEAETSAAVDALVNGLLKKHNASNPNFSLRTTSALPKAALPGVVRNNRVERLTGDLKFDASPQAAAAIIAELESSPDIESINSVRMTRDTSGKVKVQLALEAWVLSSARAAGATL
jgi:hypothetical protein